LSGGEKTLVHFARILLSNPTLLLLDEPTNHLDIERIEWLQGYIQRFKGGVVVVSHDRYFLDKVANVIIDIEDGGARYVGNYSYFVKEKEEKELRQFEEYKNEQKKIAELKKAVERLYEWGRKSDNPSMFRRAKAIQKRIDAILDKISKSGYDKLSKEEKEFLFKSSQK
jgi:ATPase subunit of ABC transporter with duplicated ATPase domains